LGSEDQRLLAPSPVEDAVREYVSALEIGAKLDLINCDERDVEIAWHRFDRRHPETGVGRLNLLLSCDQGDSVRPNPLDDLVVDLAGEQPQRQPDNSGRVRDHALDREVRLAGVGGAEHRGNTRTGVASVLVRRRRKRKAHEKLLVAWGTNYLAGMQNESGTNRARIADSQLQTAFTL
jgi:hypothetical protein